MKKLLCVVLCLLLLCPLLLPAYADSLPVIFTADSQPVVDGTMTVDREAMLSHSGITADAYNSLLEGYVIYCWYKNGLLHNSGTGATSGSYKIQQEDVGGSMYLVMEFYSDYTYQTLVATATSEAFTIQAGAVPEITTTSLPKATVGKDYYVKLACTDGDAVFSEFMGSQLSEFGMYLTQHGEIEGVPTKAGNCHVNVAVTGQGGENAFSFDITVESGSTNGQQAATEPVQVPVIDITTQVAPTEPEVTEEPVTEEPTKDAAETPKEKKDTKQKNKKSDEDPSDFPIFAFIAVALVAAGLGAGIVYLLLRKKK